MMNIPTVVWSSLRLSGWCLFALTLCHVTVLFQIKQRARMVVLFCQRFRQKRIRPQPRVYQLLILLLFVRHIFNFSIFFNFSISNNFFSGKVMLLIFSEYVLKYTVMMCTNLTNTIRCQGQRFSDFILDFLDSSTPVYLYFKLM